MSLQAQICDTFLILYLCACLWVTVHERRKREKAENEWVDRLLTEYRTDIRKRFRDGRYAPKDRYGRFSTSNHEH